MGQYGNVSTQAKRKADRPIVQRLLRRPANQHVSIQDLTLANVDDYHATGLIHVVSESWCFPNREMLLPELTNAADLYIKFRNASLCLASRPPNVHPRTVDTTSASSVRFSVAAYRL
jgi:hypothetical protein